MLEAAKTIIEEFENNLPTPSNEYDWRDSSEKITLYLAAIRYVDTQ